MTAPFDAASWVQRAEACGLARVLEGSVNIHPDVQGPEADALLAEWRGGSDEQCKLNTRAACAYVRTLSDPTRKYMVVGEAGPLSSTF